MTKNVGEFIGYVIGLILALIFLPIAIMFVMGLQIYAMKLYIWFNKMLSFMWR